MFDVIYFRRIKFRKNNTMKNTMVKSLAPDDAVTDSSNNCPDKEDHEKIVIDTNKDCEIIGSNKTERYIELLDLQKS